MISLGKDLIGVQNLLKKHQALQAEISGHEPRIKAVTQKGEAMVEEGMVVNSLQGFLKWVSAFIMLILSVCCQGTLLVRM